MIALFWLLMSGVLWLGLVQIAPHFGVPAQIISLARSGYIALFSIYLMVELRGARHSSRHRPGHLYLYFLPLVSLLLLSAFSADFVLTRSLLAVIGCFYVCAFALINVRSEAGQVRQAGWDLLAPPLLLIIMLHPVLTAAGGVAAIFYLAFVMRRPAEHADGQYLDAFIVQLPSICIAPVVLIAFRDVFNGGGMIDRTHIESFGLIVNGVGGAVWTAMVLRGKLPLARIGILLWLASFVAAVVNAFLPAGVLATAGAILAAEGFRGAMWLGTTVALTNLSRGKGFTANLIATFLPLVALWIGKDGVPQPLILLLYAAFVLPVPILALIIARGSAGGQSPDRAARQGDSESPPVGVFEQKL